jgi:hypothetical protein
VPCVIHTKLFYHPDGKSGASNKLPFKMCIENVWGPWTKFVMQIEFTNRHSPKFVTRYFKAIRITQSQITFVRTSHTALPFMTIYIANKNQFIHI